MILRPEGLVMGWGRRGGMESRCCRVCPAEGRLHCRYHDILPDSVCRVYINYRLLHVLALICRSYWWRGGSRSGPEGSRARRMGRESWRSQFVRILGHDVVEGAASDTRGNAVNQDRRGRRAEGRILLPGLSIRMREGKEVGEFVRVRLCPRSQALAEGGTMTLVVVSGGNGNNGKGRGRARNCRSGRRDVSA